MGKGFIYLASPYSHPDYRTRAYREFEVTLAAGKLYQRFKKIAIFCPITQSAQIVKVHPELAGDWKTWQYNDLVFVEQCEELWVLALPGWRDSVGVSAEIEHAQKCNKPIRYVCSETYKITKEPGDGVRKSNTSSVRRSKKSRTCQVRKQPLGRRC